MGLDVVELVMEVEEQFGVRIADREAERMRTVGDLYQFLLGKRSLVLDGCPSSAVFYRARRALIQLFCVERQAIRPSSSLEELIPLENRRDHWDRFRRAFGPFNLPRLGQPTWLSWLLTSPQPVCLPAGCATVAGLVHTTLRQNPDRVNPALKRMSERDVWDQLCEIISDHLGVDAALLKPETDFIHDLGAD
jgi:acyl carrier protein